MTSPFPDFDMASKRMFWSITVMIAIISISSLVEAADKAGFPVAIIHINDLHAR